MVNHQPGLDSTFAALADPTRRAILARLVSGERTISELAARFDMSLPAVSKHVYVLERAGLARVRREGRVRRTALVAGPMREAADWIEHYRRFWEFQFDQLAAYLAATPDSPSAESDAWRPRPDKNRDQRPPSKSGARSPRRASGSSTRGPAPRSSGSGARRGR